MSYILPLILVQASNPLYSTRHRQTRKDYIVDIFVPHLEAGHNHATWSIPKMEYVSWFHMQNIPESPCWKSSGAISYTQSGLPNKCISNFSGCTAECNREYFAGSFSYFLRDHPVLRRHVGTKLLFFLTSVCATSSFIWFRSNVGR